MRHRLTILALCTSCASLTLTAHDVITTKVTWSREVSRIIFARCTSCHHEGGSSFSLTTYEEARPWAKAIKEETLERRMPPFGAVKGFSDLKDDHSLTQEQLELISDWVEGGSPEGDPNVLPKSPDSSHSVEEPEPRLGFIVKGKGVLTRTSTFTAIRPDSVHKGSTFQVVAETPDGGVIPLIWIYQYDPNFRQTYYFRRPLTMSAGTRIVTNTADDETVALLSAPSSP